MTRMQIIQNQADFRALRDHWVDLYGKMSEPSPFMSWEWVTAWLDCIDYTIEYFVVVVADEEMVVGILPLRIKSKRLLGVGTVRVLEMLQACVQTCPDHLGILCDPNHLAEVTSHVFTYLKTISTWHLLDLKEWNQPLPLTGLPYGKVWNLRLPDSFEKYVDSMRGEKRSKLKRLRKKFEKVQNLNLCVIEKSEEIIQEMDAFVKMHANRWVGKQQSTFAMPFSQAVHKKFLQNVSTESRSLHARMVVLKNSEGLVAGIYGFCVKKVFYYYQMARDLGPHWSGVGQLIMGHAIEAAILSGDQRMDFLRGDEPFKAEWTSDFYYEQRILWANRNIVGQGYVQVQRVKNRLRKFLR